MRLNMEMLEEGGDILTPVEVNSVILKASSAALLELAEKYRPILFRNVHMAELDNRERI